MFDWENAIALDTMLGDRKSTRLNSSHLRSSRSEGEVSWVFSSCAGTSGIFSSYDGDARSKREFV